MQANTMYFLFFLAINFWVPSLYSMLAFNPTNKHSIDLLNIANNEVNAFKYYFLLDSRTVDLRLHAKLLQFSVMCGHIECTKALLDINAKALNYTDNFGKTLLDIAARNNYVSIVELLQSKGAHYCINKNGNSLLHKASKKNQCALAHVLIKHSIEINRKNHAGHTPLWIASAYKHSEMVKILLDAGAAAC